MRKKRFLSFAVVIIVVVPAIYTIWYRSVLSDCVRMASGGFRAVAETRDDRFLGKVKVGTAMCRGGNSALVGRDTPWVDWSNYWATADSNSRSRWVVPLPGVLSRDRRGTDGALLDLEYQRIELIKFNLFDNYTFQQYLTGRADTSGRALKRWVEMELPPDHQNFADLEHVHGGQRCWGELVRHRTLTGICNDIINPAMGSTNQLFARNVPFETTFPRLGEGELARNRHGNRLGLLQPDPQVISRVLFTRQEAVADSTCNAGQGLPDHALDAHCSYKKAPFFNVLAAFWIQFMTHDWFSHLREGHNQQEMMEVGCTPADAGRFGCRLNDMMERAYIAQDDAPPTFTHGERSYLSRAPRTTRNTVTAWWDASQIYGYDSTSLRRVKRDPNDPAKLLMVERGNDSGDGERYGYLTVFNVTDPINPAWAGQESVAFPDNWTIGLSFYHNLFAREHNIFVDTFRARVAETPGGDSGLRNPSDPDRVIRYGDVTPDELFQVARLVVSAEIAKIHTIEWTTQLLYDEPLYQAMNANWYGLIREDNLLSRALETVVVDGFRNSPDADAATQWYAAFASGAGIFGLGNRRFSGLLSFLPFYKGTDTWYVGNPDHVNGGINHFGSPFNFPEEFVTVYRLHPLVPDLIEYREWDSDPNVIRNMVPVVETFRGRATQAMEYGGLANWAISMGRQRLGLLTLQNHPRFLQNLKMPRLQTATNQIDVVALDIIRDRERGIPRFNEFRRQYGLKQLTSFGDFIDTRLPPESADRQEQERLATLLREVYGQHSCDVRKVITDAQRNDDGSAINDCLGHQDGSLIDNVEDVDVVVGWLAEFTRPHGFAISETQFQVFILNASRRLFSDRFFTSSFRPEFYTDLGIEWVTNNGPGPMRIEGGRPNGHEAEVSPLKRILLRAIPELSDELDGVVNVFDPWARDRGDYYSLQWKPRSGAQEDEAFGDR